MDGVEGMEMDERKLADELNFFFFFLKKRLG